MAPPYAGPAIAKTTIRIAAIRPIGTGLERHDNCRLLKGADDVPLGRRTNSPCMGEVQSPNGQKYSPSKLNPRQRVAPHRETAATQRALRARTCRRPARMAQGKRGYW